MQHATVIESSLMSGCY